MSRRPRSWPARAIAAAVLVCVVGGMAWAEAGAQANNRRDLQDRFAVRAATVEGFLETYVGYVLDRERALAEQQLAGATVTQPQFESFRQALDFGPSVLLDANGVAIGAAPPQPALIGSNLAAADADLMAAENGRRAVSDAEPDIPGPATIDFVTSFDSAVGPRTVSGSYDLATQPIGAYLSHGIPFAGSDVYLIDSHDEILADSSGVTGGLDHVDSAVTQAMAASATRGTYRTSAGATGYFVTDPVAETPWRLVLTIPTANLLEPLNRSTQVLPWLFLIALGVAGAALAALLVRGVERHRRLEVVALVDPLTAIPNRRATEDHLARMLSTVYRHGATLGLLMIDVDNFKSYNDTFGHAMGDEVLHAVAKGIQTCLRADDVVGRWGGEEFVVLIPMADAEGTRVLAERIRAGIFGLLPRAGTDVHVTVSIGAALSNGDDVAGTLLGRADAALYRAKLSGRNCVVAAVVEPVRMTLVTPRTDPEAPTGRPAPDEPEGGDQPGVDGAGIDRVPVPPR